MKRTSARSTTRLRPRVSAREEARGEMRRAKSEVDDVIRDLSRVVRGAPREVFMDTKVADITPVSSVRLLVSVGGEEGRGRCTAK